MSLRCKAMLSSPSSKLRFGGFVDAAVLLFLVLPEPVAVLSFVLGRRSPLLNPGVRRSEVWSLPTCAFQKKYLLRRSSSSARVSSSGLSEER